MLLSMYIYVVYNIFAINFQGFACKWPKWNNIEFTSGVFIHFVLNWEEEVLFYLEILLN